MYKYRKATMADVEPLHEMINKFADAGVMLARSRNTLYESLREFIIIEHENGTLAGCGALHIVWDDLAEIRALAIVPDHQHHGLGKKLIEELSVEAQTLGIHQLFALTYQVEFFKSCGFSEVSKDAMPPKVWKECINCPKFPNCDEVAVIKRI